MPALPTLLLKAMAPFRGPNPELPTKTRGYTLYDAVQREGWGKGFLEAHSQPARYVKPRLGRRKGRIEVALRKKLYRSRREQEACTQVAE